MLPHRLTVLAKTQGAQQRAAQRIQSL